MARIHLLEDAVINKIAAGEVVERPASVVKELVENAVDAGATEIRVSLELGGARSIAVTDNGSGMPVEDAELALTRHATSKIRAADDLFQIYTMGFRGEALASIASVSRFSLATTHREAAEGVKLTVAGGEDLATWPWSGATGTTVAVENLFYNVPVRAKFLKAPATEFSHCLELVQAFALCHPEIGFTVQHNNKEHFRVAASQVEGRPWLGEQAMRERALAVVGKDAASLIYVRTSARYGDLEALVSPPGLERPTSKHLFTFVNGRWVKDKTMRYGILRGYHSHILKGKFPVAIVHLTMDPALVDVNVHPAKTELRFQYPGEVQSLLALAIRDKLRDGTWAAPTSVPDFRGNHIAPPPPGARPAGGADFDLDLATPQAATSSYRPSFETTRATASSAESATMSRRSFGGATRGPGGGFGWARPVADKAGLDALLDVSGETSSPDFQRNDALPRVEETVPWDDLEYLGSFDRCFLFFGVRTSASSRLLIIDQHAFHERILYERLLRDESLLSQSQGLLVPEAIELSPTEVATLRARRPALVARGFDFQAEGATTISVRAVPSLLANRDLAELLASLAREPENFGEGAEGQEPAESNAEIARLILATAACHAAVRAGEELPEGELKQLLAAARTVDFFHNCPHGRRVLRWWSRDQVARWFDR